MGWWPPLSLLRRIGGHYRAVPLWARLPSRDCRRHPARHAGSLVSSETPAEGTRVESRSFSSIDTPSSLESEGRRPPLGYRLGRGLTLKHLMDARVHMGHRTRLWNPRMAPYIFGHRNGMHVIDLDKTLVMLRRSLVVVSKMAEAGCTFLWLGPRDEQKQKLMEKVAKQVGVYTLSGRWVGGTLTNPIASGQAENIGYRIPDCLFVVDTLRHSPALREADRLGIPTIGIVDSDCDPTAVTYPIPGNDDGAHALNLYFQLMRLAIEDGRAHAVATRESGQDFHGTRSRKALPTTLEERETGSMGEHNLLDARS